MEIPASIVPVVTPAATTVETPASTPTNGFTRVPIAVKDAPAAAPAAPAATETANDGKGADAVPKTEAELISALTKANSENRKVKAANAEFSSKLTALQADLDSAREGSSKAQHLEAQIADMLSKPRKYLDLYKAKGENKLAEILNGFAEDEVPGNPEVLELRKRLDERDERERKEAEERKKSEESTTASEQTRINKEVNDWISSLITGEPGKVADDNGVTRWALISDDPGVPERARLEARQFAIDNNLKLTEEAKQDLVCQALDQMESDARADAIAKAERLKIKREKDLTGGRNTFSLGNERQSDSGSQRKAIDSSVRGTLPPPSEKSFQHGFTTRR